MITTKFCTWQDSCAVLLCRTFVVIGWPVTQLIIVCEVVPVNGISNMYFIFVSEYEIFLFFQTLVQVQKFKKHVKDIAIKWGHFIVMYPFTNGKFFMKTNLLYLLFIPFFAIDVMHIVEYFPLEYCNESILIYFDLIYWGLNKIAGILKMIISNTFSWIKFMIFWFKFCFQESNDRKAALVWVIAWCLTGTWTHDDLVNWHIYVSPGLF